MTSTSLCDRRKQSSRKQIVNLKQPVPLPSLTARLLSKPKRLIAAALSLAAVIYFMQASFLITTKLDNGSFFIDNYPIDVENPYHPRLQLLRQREQLDKVLAPGATELDKVRLLLGWTHRQLRPSSKFYYPPWDAVEILDLARKYGNGGFCAQYAIVMLQACLSVGLHARYIDLPGHFMLAVWLDDLEKWAAMDPYNDRYYEKDGVPLDGYKLYEAYHNDDVKNILEVTSAGVKTHIKREDLSVFDKYAIVLRNNQLSDPILVDVRGRREKLTINPDHTAYPLFGRDNITILDSFLSFKALPGQDIGERRWTSDPDDFWNDKNQTMIQFSQSKKNDRAVKVLLAPVNAHFKGFLINANGKGWQESADKLIWEIKPGFNTLQARALTQFGWKGHISTVKLYYKRPWLFRHEKRQGDGSGRYVKSV